MLPTGPLSGVRIIDLTSIYSGPICASILGDQGAHVIKVEAPGGDLMRQGTPNRNGVTASFSMMNRNKQLRGHRSAEPAGRALLLDLVHTADAVIENYRPGVNWSGSVLATTCSLRINPAGSSREVGRIWSR